MQQLQQATAPIRKEHHSERRHCRDRPIGPLLQRRTLLWQCPRTVGRPVWTSIHGTTVNNNHYGLCMAMNMRLSQEIEPKKKATTVRLAAVIIFAALSSNSSIAIHWRLIWLLWRMPLAWQALGVSNLVHKRRQHLARQGLLHHNDRALSALQTTAHIPLCSVSIKDVCQRYLSR
jgi:hypothetical protein